MIDFVRLAFQNLETQEHRLKPMLQNQREAPQGSPTRPALQGRYTFARQASKVRRPFPVKALEKQ